MEETDLDCCLAVLAETGRAFDVLRLPRHLPLSARPSLADAARALLGRPLDPATMDKVSSTNAGRFYRAP